MPGIGHLIFGLCIVVPLLYLTKDSSKPLNYKVAFIYFVNNYLGPDAAHVYWDPAHMLVGFLVFAIPLSLFYSYMSRFSLQRTKHFVEIMDDGKREVNWKNSYYATVAGGISHRLIDGLFHASNHFGLSDWFDLGLADFNTWTVDTSSSWIVLDMAFIILAIIGAMYMFREGVKKSLQFLGIIAGLFIVAALGTALEIQNGERDLAVIFFSSLFFLAPLLLIAHANKEVLARPGSTVMRAHVTYKLSIPLVAGVSVAGILSTIFFGLEIGGFFFFSLPFFVSLMIDIRGPNDPPRVSRKFLVPFLISVVTAVVLLFLVAGIAATIAPVWFGTELYEFGSPGGTQTVGVIFIFLMSVGLVGCIGTFFHNAKCRSIVMVICTLAWYLVIPFGLALVLSEKDVKAWFEKPARDEQA